MPSSTIVAIEGEATTASSKRQRSRSVIRDFSENTSTHGIPGIARSESLFNGLFWSISLLIFIGVMLYFIIKSIIVYFSYPTQTSVDTVTEWPQAFPAVTVCNYSPFVYSQFILPFLKYTNSLNLTNTTNTNRANFTAKQASYVQDFILYTLNKDDSLKAFAYPLQSMLINCSYNNIPCSTTNFASFSSLRYGICYTFNAKARNTTDGNIRFSSDNGGDGTLTLKFYVHRHQYVPYVTRAVGMMVMVHDNDQFPFIALSGLQLAPGRNHKLSYTKKTNVFLPSPYTSCTNRVSRSMQMMIDRYQGANYTYSQSLCYTACSQTTVYQNCGCVSASNWINRFIDVPGTDAVVVAPLCNWTDACAARVLAEIAQQGSLRDEHCPQCGPECKMNTFLIKSSSLTAPVDSDIDAIKTFVEASSIPLPANWSDIRSTEIAANYISLEVICETTRTEIYTQQASVSAIDLLSNIGGQTGLWIGMSFLSLFEIAEMIYRLVRVQCYYLRNRLKERLRQGQNNIKV